MADTVLVFVMIVALVAAWWAMHWLATAIFAIHWIWGLAACALVYGVSIVMDRYGR